MRYNFSYKRDKPLLNTIEQRKHEDKMQYFARQLNTDRNTVAYVMEHMTRARLIEIRLEWEKQCSVQ